MPYAASPQPSLGGATATNAQAVSLAGTIPASANAPATPAIPSPTIPTNPVLPTTSISTANLTAPAPVAVPPPVTTAQNPATGISANSDQSVATTQAQIDQNALIQKQKDQVTVDQAAKDASQTKLQSLMDSITGVQQSRSTIEANLHVPELAQVNNDAFTALQASKRAQEKELLALKSQNLTDQGRATAERDINRAYAFNQADLSISLDVSNRNYSLAQSTADRKIQLQLEPLQTQLDFQKIFYQDNKDKLTTDENRQFELTIKKNQDELDKQKTDLKTLSDTKLEYMKNANEQGAPSSVISTIQAATTPGDVVNAAGRYGQSNQYTSVQSFDPTTGMPIFSSFNTRTGKYGDTSGGSSSSTQPSNNTQSTNSTGSTYNQYGLLSNTNFNADNYGDKQAYNYLSVYLTEGRVPNASDVGIRGYGQGSGIQFTNAASRARELYFKATGQTLPTPQVIANNIKLINTNNDFVNKLTTQEQTVRQNVDLSLANMNKNGLNSSSFRPLDNLINTARDLFNDPAVGQFLSQNTTIQNELGSLLAVKNASGTTVYDKLQSAGIISSTDTPETVRTKVNTLLQEAGNFSTAIKSVNGDLYRKIDPLELNPDNPNRQNKLNNAQNGVMTSADGTQQVKISDLTPAQIQEAKNAGWK